MNYRGNIDNSILDLKYQNNQESAELDKICSLNIHETDIDVLLIEQLNYFVLDKNIHILNAPSPAATACLAIGDEIVEHATKSFDLNNK